MKKLLLLFTFILYYSLSFGQTLAPVVSTVESGDKVILRASGETFNTSFTSVQNFSSIKVTSPAGVNGDTYVGIEALTQTKWFNSVTSSPSEFTFTVRNNYPSAVTANFTFQTNTVSGVVSDRIFTLTINPRPTIWTNDAIKEPFYKSCDPGYKSEPYYYVVPQGKYTSTISAQDANAKARAEVNANGQNAANANSVCKILYYNTTITGSFRKNNCGNGVGETEISTTIAANRFSAFTQEDAQAQAQAALNSEGQARANAEGTCPPSMVGGRPSFPRTNSYAFQASISPLSGTTITYVWTANRATITSGQGTSEAMIYFGNAGNITINLKATRSNGEVINLSKTVTVTPCTTCPLE